jgi:phage terminase large subunit
MFIVNKTLYIDYERVKVGVEIDQTPAFFAGPDTQRTPPRWEPVAGYTGIPGALKWPITADSARPETISYLQRRGFRITPAVKGAGSIEEGITFLQDYDIIIHPRCVHTIDEFATYSYKVDPKTDEVLPVLEDKKNHVIDSARYALEGTRRGTYSLNSRNLG